MGLIRRYARAVAAESGATVALPLERVLGGMMMDARLTAPCHSGPETDLQGRR